MPLKLNVHLHCHLQMLCDNILQLPVQFIYREDRMLQPQEHVNSYIASKWTQ